MTWLEQRAGQTRSRLLQIIHLASIVLALGALTYYVILSWRWTIVWDTSVMHYVNFLIDHGFRPYRDISDSNLPGTYLTDRWAMAVFGKGDLAWRLYDFFLSALTILSFIIIAAPYDWAAGLLAGAVFCLAHGSEGPNSAVEREQIMTALLAVSLAASFLSVRRRLPWVQIVFGAALGFAITIKPTCLPLGLAILAAALWQVHRRREPLSPTLRFALVGGLLPAAAMFFFFARTHSLGDFIWITRTLLPAYVSSRADTWPELVRLLFPRNVLILLVLALPLAVLAHRAKSGLRWNLERWTIFLAMLFGAVSFFAQRKGFVYQRYPFLAFLFLLLTLEFFSAIEVVPEPRDGATNTESTSALFATKWAIPLLGGLGLLALLGISLPHYLIEMRRSVPLSAMPFTASLQRDLARLGPANLQRNIECFDLTDGCFSALYHLDIVQSNGFTGDLLFFSPTPSPVADFYRHKYWQLTSARPPEVLVLSDNWFQAGHTFNKVNAWPEFAKNLRQNYVAVVTRYLTVPGATYGSNEPPGYRIYVRRSSPLLSRAEDLFH